MWSDFQTLVIKFGNDIHVYTTCHYDLHYLSF